MRKLVMCMGVAILLAAAGAMTRAQSAGASDKATQVQAEEARGDLAQQKKDFEASAAAYEKALRLDRTNPELYNKLGVVELRMNDYRQARKDFQKALKYDPKYVYAMNNLGVVEILNKRYKSAADYLKQSLALDEQNAHTHLNLAEAWLGMGEVSRAMTEYTRALELDADVLSTSQQGVQAQVYTPEQRARISFLIAKLFMQRNNLDRALEYLDRAKELNYPNLHQVYDDPAFTPLWNDPRLAKIVKR